MSAYVLDYSGLKGNSTKAVSHYSIVRYQQASPQTHHAITQETAPEARRGHTAQ